ncbi:MAG TPA: cation diffusion facilitator family transporter [Nocardioides sp.]|jgi:cation diffusion facilitator family transporter|uniref:cation diffusion facilitator family transporter n=1 Tax=Nocardioides sp. TaxID=35761 RepID=UPI002E2F50BF|nr:cation diffusion facilitator family transporter [Nocardioides sp.]HEX3930460.1 cation diffusion facilitator family transporter [Nocardioides sp.]
MATEGSTKAVVAALLANSGIAVTKFLAFLLTGASSMLAESIHSVADSGNQALLLLGGRRSRRAPSEEHPFGYGRERYVYAFIVSIVLFSVGGLFALYEAYHKAHELHRAHGHPHDSLLDSRWAWVPIVVLLAAIVMEGLSFRTAIREADRVRGEASFVQFVRRAKGPELPVILLEDFAALCGLVFALLGVGLSLLTSNLWWDVVGTALIGLLLVVVAVVLGVETKSLLLGEGASAAAVRRIVDAVDSTDGIDGVVHLKTMHLGPDELLVAAKIAVPPEATARAIAEAIDAAEAAIRAVEPIARVIYLEPDIARVPS